ncbi:hypothetical protein N7475_001887 [Penicillium sp. IBT 31633x]|nr:hypothetical protein N7475_001887 [Penicillium sp. IBT 31633x]
MHFSAFVLAASLASAQYAHQQDGPSREELDHLKHIKGSHNQYPQAQHENQSYDPNGNLNYDGNYNEKHNNGNHDDYQNAPTPPVPVHAQAASSSPASMTHGTFVVRPSQSPIASPQAQTPANGYSYPYPTPSTASQPALHPDTAAPAPRSSQHQSPDPQSRTHQPAAPANPASAPQSQHVPVGASGGVAPIDPMRPGSQVAPVSWGKQQFGKDEGNTFCVGQCFADEREAQCGKPYSSLEFMIL